MLRSITFMVITAAAIWALAYVFSILIGTFFSIKLFFEGLFEESKGMYERRQRTRTRNTLPRTRE